MRLHIAAGCLLLAFLAIYLPHLGHGFIKDDFRWIAESRVASLDDAVGLFERNVGFYRPLVSASFALDQSLWGLDPFRYGLTNLAIFLVDAMLLFQLARQLLLPGSVALLAVSIWAFNFHGVNMSLLWISGRTALLMVMFALLAAIAVLGGRRRLGGILSLLAMLCKEEAVLLPALFVAFDWLDHPRGSPHTWWRSARASVLGAWPAWAALAVYSGLRLNSGAFGPGNAPSYYQFAYAPPTLLRNALEYLDREATVACAALLVTWLFTRQRGVTLNTDERRASRFGAVWVVSFNALTLFLPVRSDLYALAPSVGIALIAGSIASAVRRAAPERFASSCVALTVLVFLVIPIHLQRNERWVAPAELSASVLRSLTLATSGETSGRLVLIDDPSARHNLEGSFGALIGDAVRLTVGPGWEGEIAQSPDGTGGTMGADPTRTIFVLRDGVIRAASD